MQISFMIERNCLFTKNKEKIDKCCIVLSDKKCESIFSRKMYKSKANKLCNAIIYSIKTSIFFKLIFFFSLRNLNCTLKICCCFFSSREKKS